MKSGTDLPVCCTASFNCATSFSFPPGRSKSLKSKMGMSAYSTKLTLKYGTGFVFGGFLSEFEGALQLTFMLGHRRMDVCVQGWWRGHLHLRSHAAKFRTKGLVYSGWVTICTASARKLWV